MARSCWCPDARLMGMQRCWERPRREIRIRGTCTSSMSLNTCLFLEMLAEGGSQTRTGLEWRLLPHTLSDMHNCHHTMVKSDSLGVLGVSMVTQADSQFIMLSLEERDASFSLLAANSSSSPARFSLVLLAMPHALTLLPLHLRTGQSQSARPQGLVHGRGHIPGDVPIASCCGAAHCGLHGTGPHPASTSSQAEPLVCALPQQCSQ